MVNAMNTLQLPDDTEFSKWQLTEHAFSLASRQCGKALGDGMVNCSDIETLRIWQTDKTKIVRVMVGHGNDDAEWVSLRLEEFDALEKRRRGHGTTSYWLIEKSALVPNARQSQPSPQSMVEPIYFNSLPGHLTSNPKAHTLHKALISAGIKSPFIMQGDVAIGITLEK